MVQAKKLFKAGPLAQQYQVGLSLAQNCAKLQDTQRSSEQGELFLIGSSCAPRILELRL
jgi:hypothetical protein